MVGSWASFIKHTRVHMRGMNTHTLACTPITHTHTRTPHIQRLTHTHTHTPHIQTHTHTHTHTTHTDSHTHTHTQGQVTTYSVTGDGGELSLVPVLSGIVRNKQKSFAALLQEGEKNECYILAHPRFSSESNSVQSQLGRNWILMFCQPHRVTSGWPNSGISKFMHTSKTLLPYVNFFSSQIYQISPTNALQMNQGVHTHAKDHVCTLKFQQFTSVWWMMETPK